MSRYAEQIRHAAPFSIRRAGLAAPQRIACAACA